MKFPDVPGKTPYDRFINLVRHVISVPKADIDKGSTKTRKRRVKRSIGA
jgi:hypothetical protein